ncbi:MAG TPA: trigger factor, partial [Pirellulaceae bacterium]|nr:trigger factor [Pirellulaceae bacterium]
MNTDLTTTGLAATGDDNEETAIAEEGQSAKQPLVLTVDVETIGACQRHVSVSISREDIDRYFQREFDEIAPKAEVPGFRPGRAPRKLLENKFRRQVTDKVKGSLIMDALSQMVDEQRFAAISEPDLNYEIVKIPDEGPLTFEFNIEVRPDFELPNWKGLEIEVPDVEVSSDEIDRIVEYYRNNYRDMTPVEDAVQADDLITCHVRVSHEQDTIQQLEEVVFEVRPTVTFHDAEIAGFDKLLSGAKAGDTRTAEVKVTVTDDAGQESEKTVSVVFEVLDVKRPVPISDEELADKMSFGTSSDMRDAMVTSLTRRKEYDRRRAIRSAISSLLTESANWELPPSLLKRQSHRELERALIELQSSGFDEEE